MWKCSYCDKTTDEGPGWRSKRSEPYGKCPKCGFTLGRAKATIEKLEILTDICNTNNYDILIDACAGSGKVQLYKGDIINGSSLLFEEIAQRKKPPAKVVSIECDSKTFKLLEKFFEGSETELIRGDCNEHIMEYATGEVRTLFFIDPFGWGVPAIDRNKVIKISQTPNTDLLFNFTYRISREMGYVRNNLESSIERNRKTANTWKKALHIFWGTLDWLDKWGSMNALEYAEKYASPLRKNNKVRLYRIPVHGRLTYRLIFATKFDIPKYGIEKFF